MAEIKITGLNSHSELQLDGNDVLPIVDVSSPETKKIAISELDKRYKEPTEELETQVDINTADIDLLKAGVIPADNSVSTDKIQNLAVTEPKIANLAVTTAKIANSNVTGPKIANQSVSVAKLASDVTDLLSPGYIVNGTAEADTSGWLVYKDAVQALPEDGSGTGASVTWTRGDTNPLRGDGHFVFTKGATNEQGEGVATDFEIENADLAKVLTISMEYTVLSGTYQSGDLTVYIIQDPDGTPQVIQPAGFSIESVSIGTQNKLIATFQTSATVKNYRLCFHVASSSADAYSLAFDSINVQHRPQLYGAPITDWQSYTPTFTGFGTPSNVAMYWRRVGDSVEITGSFTAGTTTATEARIGLPNNYVVDSNKLGSQLRAVGILGRPASSSDFFGNYLIAERGVSYLTISQQTHDSHKLTKGNGTIISNSQVVTLSNVSVPVAGWGSSVQMSSDTDTRVVAFRAGGCTTTSGNSGLINLTLYDLRYPTIQSDTHGSGASTGYTIFSPGFYNISAYVIASGTYAPGAYGGINLYLQKNSVDIATQLVRNTAGDGNVGAYAHANSVYCNAGEVIKARMQLSGWSSVGILSDTHLMINRLSGPSTIAATETVAFNYQLGSSYSYTAGTAIYANTKIFDTHNSYVAGNTSAGSFYRVPVPGIYKFKVSADKSGDTLAFSLNVYKNDVLYGENGWAQDAGFYEWLVQCNAGDKIHFSIAISGTLAPSYTTISGYRVG